MLATPVFLGTLALLLPAFPPDTSRPAFDPGRKRRVALASGVTMAYLEAGPKDEPPLVLLHGLGDTGRSWSFVLPELAERHRVYVLDQRGHGETEAPACCYALADLVYDVVTFMDAMRIERAAVAGHSLGSFVAQHLAADHPARVSRLVLLGSADTTVGNEVFDWLWGETRAFDSKVSAAFVDAWQTNPTPVDEGFMAKVKSETAAVPVHVWRNVARALLTEDHRRFLAEIKVPSMILWGGKDPMFKGDAQERLRKALPHAVFKAYPEVGHNLHWEVPKQVAEDVEAFLRPTPSP